MGDRRVDVERFPRNALLLFIPEVLERAHVVEAVGELDHHYANVVDHRQQHFANVFGLAGFRSGHIEAADFGYAFDKPCDVRSEAFFNARDGYSVSSMAS